MNRFAVWFVNLFYPAKCIFCGRLLPGDVPDCCDKCIHSLPEYDDADRTVQYFDRTTALFYYRSPVREAILSYKFHGTHSYADVFARWMAAQIRVKFDGTYDLISWVPCSARRRWSRGYDQSRLLAERLGRELGTEVRCTLRKVRHNRAQSGIGKEAERKANVLGVYVAVDPSAVRGKRILLVDDVLTTGATVSECGKILKLAGADSLSCAVIAAAKQDHDK